MSTPISGPGCSSPVSDVVSNAVLEGIVVAMSAHPTQTEARRQVKAQGARVFIMGLLPQNALQMMIAGQAALFHELIADAGHDVLAALSGPGKERARRSVNAMSRTLCKNLEMLVRLQGMPEPVAVAVEKPAHAAPVVEAAALSTEQPVAEFSWLDEPYEEWIIATPADIAAMQAGSPEAAALAEGADAVLVPAAAAAATASVTAPWRADGDGDGSVAFHGTAVSGADMPQPDPATMPYGPGAVVPVERHGQAAR